jgi:hypothetical protein
MVSSSSSKPRGAMAGGGRPRKATEGSGGLGANGGRWWSIGNRSGTGWSWPKAGRAWLSGLPRVCARRLWLRVCVVCSTAIRQPTTFQPQSRPQTERARRGYGDGGSGDDERVFRQALVLLSCSPCPVLSRPFLACPVPALPDPCRYGRSGRLCCAGWRRGRASRAGCV